MGRPSNQHSTISRVPAAYLPQSRRGGGRLGSLLDRERTVAPPGFNRWLIPPAAQAVHLCIGEIYGFSVF